MPKVTYITLAGSDPEAKKHIKNAFSARLYVNGWCLRALLKRACRIPDDAILTISMAYADDKPIGVAVRPMNRGEAIWVFVREKYRRNGIGKQLVNNIIEFDDMVEFTHGRGATRTHSFWKQEFNCTSKYHWW